MSWLLFQLNLGSGAAQAAQISSVDVAATVGAASGSTAAISDTEAIAESPGAPATTASAAAAPEGIASVAGAAAATGAGSSSSSDAQIVGVAGGEATGSAAGAAEATLSATTASSSSNSSSSTERDASTTSTTAAASSPADTTDPKTGQATGSGTAAPSSATSDDRIGALASSGIGASAASVEGELAGAVVGTEATPQIALISSSSEPESFGAPFGAQGAEEAPPDVPTGGGGGALYFNWHTPTWRAPPIAAKPPDVPKPRPRAKPQLELIARLDGREDGGEHGAAGGAGSACVASRIEIDAPRTRARASCEVAGHTLALRDVGAGESAATSLGPANDVDAPSGATTGACVARITSVDWKPRPLSLETAIAARDEPIDEVVAPLIALDRPKLRGSAALKERFFGRFGPTRHAALKLLVGGVGARAKKTVPTVERASGLRAGADAVRVRRAAKK